jgi:predicted nucleic acid-binding protein
VGALDLSALPDGALVLLDAAPIIYVFEHNLAYLPRFQPLFDRHAEGSVSFAVSAITLAEVLAGPFAAGNEVLAKRYRATLESWQIVDLTSALAEDAARLRARLKLRLADAVQVASALAINAHALVTHDRDFSRVRDLPILT